MIPQEEKLSQSQISQYKTKGTGPPSEGEEGKGNLLVEKKVSKEPYMSC